MHLYSQFGLLLVYTQLGLVIYPQFGHFVYPQFGLLIYPQLGSASSQLEGPAKGSQEISTLSK